MIIDKIAPKILKNSFDIAADKISKFSEQIDKSRKVCYSRVSTNPFVPLEQDMFELSKECQFVKMLNSHFKKVPITVSVEGKSYTWNKYIDSQMGSQDAFWARNESTGELFYVKFAKNKVKEGHIDSEIKASKLYNLAGISTPEIKPITINGKSAKHPIKTKSFFETIAEKDYKQDFDIEPVYHWFRMANPEDFVINVLPKKGDVYTLKDVLCCSTHKHYAEMGYGDHVVSQNIKFIIHPKSEISRAYNLGYNQEVIYPSGEQFRILDKDCVEYIDKKTGFGRMLWEVHIQEV